MKTTIVELKVTLRTVVELLESPDSKFGDSISVANADPTCEFININHFPEKHRPQIRGMLVEMLQEAEWEEQVEGLGDPAPLKLKI